jgi:hypothetical protein
MKGVCGYKRQQVTGGWGKLQNEKIRIIIRVSVSSRIRKDMPAAYTETTSNAM